MKVLVIPDVHLKPYMFQHAAALMHQKIADRVVCLMDLADDWGKDGIGLWAFLLLLLMLLMLLYGGMLYDRCRDI